MRKLLNIDCKDMVSQLYVISSVASNWYLVKKILDIDCKDMVSYLDVC